MIHYGVKAEDIVHNISHRCLTQFLIEFKVNHVNVQGMYGHDINKKLAFKVRGCRGGLFLFG